MWSFPAFGFSLQTSEHPQKAADGNVLHVQRPERFQNLCNDNMAHKSGVVDQILRQPFFAWKPAFSMIFRSGHSVQNRTDCY